MYIILLTIFLWFSSVSSVDTDEIMEIIGGMRRKVDQPQPPNEVQAEHMFPEINMAEENAGDGQAQQQNMDHGPAKQVNVQQPNSI